MLEWILTKGRQDQRMCKDARLLASLLTRLNSYKSVSLLNFQSPGIVAGSPKGSTGCQYSTDPPSSAEMTKSNLGLYYPQNEQA